MTTIEPRDNLSQCKACGKEILWVKTEYGNNMPVDARATKVFTTNKSWIMAHIPHWVTCPERHQFKK